MPLECNAVNVLHSWFFAAVPPGRADSVAISRRLKSPASARSSLRDELTLKKTVTVGATNLRHFAAVLAAFSRLVLIVVVAKTRHFIDGLSDSIQRTNISIARGRSADVENLSTLDIGEHFKMTQGENLAVELIHRV